MEKTQDFFFRKHEKSEMHLCAQQFWQKYRGKGKTICDQISSCHTKQVEENRIYLKCIIETILLLGKQGLSLRGHDEKEDSVH